MGGTAGASAPLIFMREQDKAGKMIKLSGSG
jgi:hypothetical protein